MSRFSEVAGLLFRGEAAHPQFAAHVAALDRARADTMPDEALLDLLLGCAQRGHTEPGLAARALASFGSFARLLAAGERELRAVPGFGTHTVAAIRLLHEAAIRLAREGLLRRRLLDDPARLDAYLAAVLARERIEQFRILFLDADDALIMDEAQASGTVNHTPVYPREVVRRALELDAVAIVLVHNHPSGDPTPSADDIDMTRQIQDAAAVLDIAVRDHIIVGNGRTLSFRAHGLIAGQPRDRRSHASGDQGSGSAIVDMASAICSGPPGGGQVPLP